MMDIKKKTQTCFRPSSPHMNLVTLCECIIWTESLVSMYLHLLIIWTFQKQSMFCNAFFFNEKAYNFCWISVFCSHQFWCVDRCIDASCRVLRFLSLRAVKDFVFVLGIFNTWFDLKNMKLYFHVLLYPLLSRVN